MPTRCNRGFYCGSYCLLNMFRASLCPSSEAQEYYTVVLYVEIKWHWMQQRFLLQILLLAQHVSGIAMPIIRSSRVLYSGFICGNKMTTGCNRGFYCRSYCLLNMFRASLCPSAEGYVLQHPANQTHNPQLHTRPATWKPQHEIPQAATTIILMSSWWWA